MSSSIFHTLFSPKSIAIVGASRSPSKVGYQILKNLISSGFKGKLYPINPHASRILGLTCYPTLSSLPAIPDYIIIVTPPGLVATILEEAGRLHIKAAIVITAGFAEVGKQGAQLQRQIETSIKRYPIRVLGPNCLGLLSTKQRLNATFGPRLPISGSVFLISQSGAMVTGILDWSLHHQVGLSHAVTLGNRIDINENEALEFAANNSDVKVILVYIESFKDPQSFFRIANRITEHKPIILLKGGQSQEGQHASASHTAALASDYALIQAFAEQTGVIATTDLKQFLESATLFTQDRQIQGSQIAILTNAGGPGVVTTDNAIEAGLAVEPVTAITQRSLINALSLHKPENPIDLLGDALPEHFLSALNIIHQDTVQDAIVVLITPQTTTKPLQVAKYIVQFQAKSTKPVLVCLIGGQALESARVLLTRAGVPVFTYPSDAINLLSLSAQYYRHSQQPNQLLEKRPARFQISSSAQRLQSHHFTINQAFGLLSKYQIPVARYATVHDISHLSAAFQRLRKPLVIKTAGMHILHKLAHGGVHTNIMTATQARLAYRQLVALHKEVLLQEQLSIQAEIIVGLNRDPQFGPFITVGLGGSITNTLNDRAYAFLPTSKRYLKTIISRTKVYSLLQNKPQLLSQLVDIMYQYQLLFLDHPEIRETEINPLLITHSGLVAVDIKMQVTSHE